MTAKNSWLAIVILGFALSACKQRRGPQPLAMGVGGGRTTVDGESEQSPIQIIMYGDSEIGMNVPVEMLGRPPTPEQEERGLNFQDEDAWTATAVLYLLALEEAAGVDGERLEGLGLTTRVPGWKKIRLSSAYLRAERAVIDAFNAMRAAKGGDQAYFTEKIIEKDAAVAFKDLAGGSEAAKAMLEKLGGPEHAPDLFQFLIWKRALGDPLPDDVATLSKGLEPNEPAVAVDDLKNIQKVKRPNSVQFSSEENRMIKAMEDLAKESGSLAIKKGELVVVSPKGEILAELTYSRFNKITDPSSSKWLAKKLDGRVSDLKSATERLRAPPRAITFLGGLPRDEYLEKMGFSQVEVHAILENFELEIVPGRLSTGPVGSRGGPPSQLNNGSQAYRISSTSVVSPGNSQVSVVQTAAKDRTRIPVDVLANAMQVQRILNSRKSTATLTHCKSGKGRSATVVAATRVWEVLLALPLDVRKSLKKGDIEALIKEQKNAVQGDRQLAKVSTQQLNSIRTLFFNELAKLKKGKESLLDDSKILEI